MSNATPVLYLIDASSYVYRAFFALPPLSNATGLPTNAVYGVTTMLLKLLREAAPQYVSAVFDAPGRTFRAEAFAAYKANRTAMPDELAAQLPAVREVVAAFALHSLCVPGVEADDVIGTVAQQMTARDVDVVVITSDKDLMQLIGPRLRLWDTMRDRWCDGAAVAQRFGVRPEQLVDIMGLMGDPIDNIPGIKGIGEKTAAALIQRFGSIDALLARLDELERATDIRGAKKLAATLREQAEVARLSRDLARVRCDVPLALELEAFRYQPPSPEALRPLFTRLGFQSLVRELSASAPPLSVALRNAASATEVEAMCAAARARGHVALACDGTRSSADGGLQGVILAAGGDTPVYVPSAPTGLCAPVSALLCDAQVEKVGHDLKLDLRLLPDGAECAIAPAFDVMVASYLLEASATHRLEDLAADIMGIHLTAYRAGRESLGNGVSLLLATRDRFAAELRSRDMERLFYEVEMPLLGVLTAMERRGVRLDVPALAAMSRELDARLAQLEADIYGLAGGPFNIASPPQLRAVLFERLQLTRKGVRRGKTGLSTDVDVLSRLAAEHPLPAKILEQRMLAKLKSTYVDALPAAVSPRSGRLHTRFNQTVAATGRLSSSDPNLQNIPARGEEGRRIRAAFIAAEGCTLLVADYSQIELRVLAHLSEDPVLVQAFRDGDDVHTRTAAEVFGVLPGTITAAQRRAAKVINFGIIYGMGPQRLARELGIPLPDAEQYIANYFARYRGVRAYFEGVCIHARARGYVTTLLGRRRAMPDLSSRERGVAQAAERTAANTPIQGSAADLIKLAMIAVDRRLRAEGVQAAMILQVHDELVFEVVHGEVARTRQIVREEMESVWPLCVPLRVDLGTGPNWAAAH